MASLIKNNHLAFHSSVANAIEQARRSLGHLVKIEVEVRDLGQLQTALCCRRRRYSPRQL
jgi:nicotinate-nucleotide pyrophosphorylase (carboxylating)